MKKLKPLFFILLLSGIVACSSEDSEPTAIKIEVSDFAIAFSENPEQGDIIGTLTATVSGGTAEFNFTSQNPSGALVINEATGQITVADKTLFDFEARESITAVVSASVGSKSVTANLTISLTDIVEAPRAGLIAEYLFSGNVNDGSGNGYHIDSNSATLTTDRFSSANSAYAFNGSQYMSVDEYSQLSPNTVSVSCWFKSNSAVESQRLVFMGSVAQARQNYSLNYNIYGSEKSDFRYEPIVPYGGSYAESTSSVNDNVWHHVVGVRDGAGKSIKIYIDGVMEHSITYTYDPVPADFAFQIGRASASWLQYFTGSIDDIRIYNRVLTTEDIGLLYNEE